MFKYILVPVDGSQPSNYALQTAAALARESGARLRLIHVLDTAAFVTGYDPNGGSSAQPFSAVSDSGLRILEEGAAVVRQQGLQADHVCVDRGGTRLAEAVAQAAGEFGADLIVGALTAGTARADCCWGAVLNRSSGLRRSRCW